MKIDNKKSIYIILIIYLLGSFSLGLGKRGEIFQELDSALVYDTFSSDTNPVIPYVNFSYGTTTWGSQEKKSDHISYLIEKIDLIPDFFINILGTSSFYSYAHSKALPMQDISHEPKYVKNFILELINSRPNLREIGLNGVYRLIASSKIEALQLPRWMERSLLLPLASTYSPIMGFAYGLVYAIEIDYEKFMALATALTLSIFFISALLIYKAANNIFNDKVAVSIGVVCFASTSSIYSYAFHLGSTVWGIFAMSLLMWRLSSKKALKDEKLSSLSIFAAFLCLVNYIMFIPFMAIIFLALIVNIKKSTSSSLIANLFFSLLNTFRQHRLAIIIATVIAVIFVQPGQGIRGQMKDLNELLIYSEYILMNLYLWGSEYDLNNNKALLYFLIILFTLLIGIISFLLNDKLNKVYVNFILSVITIYLLLCIGGLLNLSPSRHILFLCVFIVFFNISILNVINKQFSKIGIPLEISTVMLIVTCCFSIYFQHDRISKLSVPFYHVNLSVSEKLLLPTNEYPRVFLKNFKQFEMLDRSYFTGLDGAYLYVNQTYSVDDFLRLDNFKYINTSNICGRSPIINSPSNVTFMAYMPKVNDERFAYNRKNSLFLEILNFCP